MRVGVLRLVFVRFHSREITLDSLDLISVISHTLKSWSMKLPCAVNQQVLRVSTVDGTETVQVIPLWRTLASSPSSKCASFHQQMHADSKIFAPRKSSSS